METTRPLMRLGVSDLEVLFKNQNQSSDVLIKLNTELAQRKGKRALALRERVLQTQKRLETQGDSNREIETDTVDESILSRRNPDPPAVQPDLWSDPQQNEVPRAGNTTDVTSSTALPSKETITDPPEMLPQLSVEDACLVLKVTVGESWERVENARRKIVLKSSPIATKGMTPAKAQKLLADAQLANYAAIVIAARRSDQS